MNTQIGAPLRARLTPIALLVAAAIGGMQAQAQVAQPGTTEGVDSLPMSKAVVEGEQLEQNKQEG